MYSRGPSNDNGSCSRDGVWDMMGAVISYMESTVASCDRNDLGNAHCVDDIWCDCLSAWPPPDQ